MRVMSVGKKRVRVLSATTSCVGMGKTAFSRVDLFDAMGMGGWTIWIYQRRLSWATKPFERKSIEIAGMAYFTPRT